MKGQIIDNDEYQRMREHIIDLEKSVSYYKKLADESAAYNYKADILLSLLKRDLEQKKNGLSFLLALHEMIGSNLDIDTFFHSTLEKLVPILKMDRAVILWNSDPDNKLYTVRCHYGYKPEEADLIRDKKFTLRDSTYYQAPQLLINKSKKNNVFEEDIGKDILLPFIIGAPIKDKKKVLGWLITGRDKEAYPFYLPLNEGDNGTLLVIAGFIQASVSITRYKKRMLAHIHEKQQIEANFQQELLRTKLEIQEQTFKIISEEIHDNVGQTLSVVKLHLNTINLARKNEALEKIEHAGNELTRSIQELRDLSKTLNTEVITAHGLMRSIEMLLQPLRKTNAIQINFQFEELPVKLDGQKELILFRIIQEALNNIIKHAQASSILIQGILEDGNLQLLIRDNGRGFSVNDLREDAGSGLRNMQSRSRLIGAHFKIKSTLAKGTAIQISLPLVLQE